MNNKQFTIYKAILGSLFIVYCLLFIAPSFASAQDKTPCKVTPNTQFTEYCLLAPIPLQPGQDAQNKATAATFLPGLFKLVIGIAGLLAVVRLMYAGILYITTDAWDQKSSAKNIIWDALSGLLLAISAWVILNTINPKLVELNLNIPQIVIEDTKGGGRGPGGSNPTGTCADCIEITGLTQKIGGSCKTPGKCSVAPELYSKLLNLNKDFNLVITESYPPTTNAHKCQCHYKGTCVDVRRVDDKQVYNFIKAASNSNLLAEFEVQTDNRKTVVINAACGGGPTQCRSDLNKQVKVVSTINADHFSVYNSSCHQ